MREQQKIIKGFELLALIIFGALSIIVTGCGGGGDAAGGGGGAADTCPGQKTCGSACIATSASCCSDGYHCVSPFTCNSNRECECPAGQQVCGSTCIPASASCCPDGSYCESPQTCNSANQCASDGSSGFVANLYHMSANGCSNGIIYGYTGPNYTVCNMYINSAIVSSCSKIINNCYGYNY